jgi:ribosomal protein S18 acetylase RimI-like enzyme
LKLQHYSQGRPGAGPINKIRITIREAREEDLGAVADLWVQLAKHHQVLSDQFSLAFDGKQKWSGYLRDRFAEISTKLIVAEEDEKIVGFMLCLLEPNVPVYKERKLGVISDVYVRQERRRKGVAEKMLDSAANWFKKNKVRTVRLNVAADNLVARAAWHMLGFEPFMIDKRLDLEGYLRREPRRKAVRVVHSKPKRKRLLQRREV